MKNVMCVCVQVNDEGYTPLMEASREGHEEMVALLLSQGADINAQTEETQETALTLACCGGFLEVADFLIKVQPLLFLFPYLITTRTVKIKEQLRCLRVCKGWVHLVRPPVYYYQY